MGTKDILVKAVEVVAFVFAAFSGFLKSVAPPEEADATFAVGISSFLMLIVLLIISAVAKGKQGSARNRLWLGVSGLFFFGAVTSAYLYKADIDRLTFAYPPESTRRDHLAGTVWTPAGREYRQAHPEETVSDIVGDFGGPTKKDLVWTVDSIQSARMRVTIRYVALVLCLAAAIFCLTEGVLAGRANDPVSSKAQ